MIGVFLKSLNIDGCDNEKIIFFLRHFFSGYCDMLPYVVEPVIFKVSEMITFEAHKIMHRGHLSCAQRSLICAPVSMGEYIWSKYARMIAIAHILPEIVSTIVSRYFFDNLFSEASKMVSYESGLNLENSIVSSLIRDVAFDYDLGSKDHLCVFTSSALVDYLKHCLSVDSEIPFIFLKIYSTIVLVIEKRNDVQILIFLKET